MLSNQWLIDMMIKDWYIQDLKDVLWERYNDYLTHDIKKNLYQKIEDKCSENEKIFKRILFYNKWIWLITEDKLKLISEKEKEIVILKDIYGYKLKEIAEIKNMNLSTVKSVYYKALKDMGGNWYVT